MDLDALGLNSTFESSELQGGYEPPVDRVDTSEIEGPEDFTMNMTYWMTADLPPAQIKSRKEAKGRRQELRMDAMQEEDAAQDATEEGDQVIIDEDDATERRVPQSNSASPTRRANGTTDERTYSTPGSERSMQYGEKVGSFLSALPDTDMEGAIAGTPLHMPKQSFLQVPRSSPPKPRSLQPTVEDYDTPRKPTQETVIHHASPLIDTNGHDVLRDMITKLQSQLDQQEVSSKTRITELETILTYTRSELENTRTDNYRQKEKVAALEKVVGEHKEEASRTQAIAEAQTKAREAALDTKMHEFGEEMRLQTLAKLENQRKDYERQIQALEDSKQIVHDEMDAGGLALRQVQNELAELRRDHEQQLEDVQNRRHESIESGNETASKQHAETSRQLSSIQQRAHDLQVQLEKATAEVRAARKDAEEKEVMCTATEAKARARASQISSLETHLQTARFELECAQADVAAKQQLFRSNMDLNSRIRALQSDLDIVRSETTTKSHDDCQNVELGTRIADLMAQLESARAEVLAKDQEVRRHTSAEEQLEQNLNVAKGRIEGLEATVTALRQQLAEAHRDSSRSKTELEGLHRDLVDTQERTQELQEDGDRRVADVQQKLSKMKDNKQDIERRLKELQSQHNDLAEGHEAMMEDIRDKAEDAVRKAGSLLDQERNEKRRIIKDLKRTKEDLEKLRAEAAQKQEEEDESSDDDSSSTSSTVTEEKDAEISNLREIIRKQVTDMKTLKFELTTLRKDNKTLETTLQSHSTLETTISDLKNDLATLQTENSTLQSSLEDTEAINAAMDEKLAALLSKVMKDRARTVVGRRDGQWQESVGKVVQEKELLGRVLMRQWGREEVGEGEKETQGYRYKYVRREKEKEGV